MANITSSDLTWKDPEASMVLSDDSDIVKNLKHRQRNIFMETHKNMKCELPDSVVIKCDRFVKDFNNSSVSRIMRNEFHDKR